MSWEKKLLSEFVERDFTYAAADVGCHVGWEREEQVKRKREKSGYQDYFH